LSISKEITIWCDAPDCPKWSQEPGSVASTIRADKQRRGWKYRNGKDYCPKHSPKRESKKAP
jgi:hypothetical protein